MRYRVLFVFVYWILWKTLPAVITQQDINIQSYPKAGVDLRYRIVGLCLLLQY